MIDIKLLREDPKAVIKDLKRRSGVDTDIVDKILKVDAKFREEKGELDKLKAAKNKESKAIAKVKKDGGDIKGQLAKVKGISLEISNKDTELKQIEEKRDTLLMKIPNILDPQVPKGADEEGNKPIRFSLEKPKFDFKIKNHQELCELNDWFDLEQAAKVSGARFYYLKKELALLQVNLYAYVLNKLVEKGYTAMDVPPMLRRDSLGRSVSLDDFEDVIYKIEKEDLYLIATAEPALAALHQDQTLNPNQLPLKYAGLSTCFRKESGVTKDSKGIFRVHNFNKIEQFIFCKPEDSDKLHDEIIANAEEIFKELEIHFRVVDICTGDIGSFAARKYDIEAWLPAQGKYREMVSASNYRDYGARRLNTRYQSEDGTLKLVHTLNSTAIALTRCLIAIIETHQTKDGNVKLPKVLRPYFGGRKHLVNR